MVEVVGDVEVDRRERSSELERRGPLVGAEQRRQDPVTQFRVGERAGDRWRVLRRLTPRVSLSFAEDVQRRLAALGPGRKMVLHAAAEGVRISPVTSG